VREKAARGTAGTAVMVTQKLLAPMTEEQGARSRGQGVEDNSWWGGGVAEVVRPAGFDARGR
jgi:hypothetical protein